MVDAPTTEEFRSLQNLIVVLTHQQDEIKANLKNLKQMYKNIFENDEDLVKHEESLSQAKKSVNDRKTELKGRGDVIELRSKIEDASEDLLMVTDSLSNHLLNYFQITGSKTVDLPGGNEREYTIKAKLKGKEKAKNKQAVGQIDIYGGEVKE